MFDYIIIGAGSARCVLANWLTEDAGGRALLLEAGGPDKQQGIQIPAAFNKLFRSECDQAYETEPQMPLYERCLFSERLHVPTMAMAQKAADLIKGVRGRKRGRATRELSRT